MTWPLGCGSPFSMGQTFDFEASRSLLTVSTAGSSRFLRPTVFQRCSCQAVPSCAKLWQRTDQGRKWYLLWWGTRLIWRRTLHTGVHTRVTKHAVELCDSLPQLVNRNLFCSTLGSEVLLLALQLCWVKSVCKSTHFAAQRSDLPMPRAPAPGCGLGCFSGTVFLDAINIAQLFFWQWNFPQPILSLISSWSKLSSLRLIKNDPWSYKSHPSGWFFKSHIVSSTSCTIPTSPLNCCSHIHTLDGRFAQHLLKKAY